MTPPLTIANSPSMQDGSSPSEYRRIKAEFDKIQRQRQRQRQRKLDAAAKPAQPPTPTCQQQKRAATPSAVTKQLEARFTATQGLLLVFFTLILWVSCPSCFLCFSLPPGGGMRDGLQDRELKVVEKESSG
jgi:hypothetical protein